MIPTAFCNGVLVIPSYAHLKSINKEGVFLMRKSCDGKCYLPIPPRAQPFPLPHI